jgi:hypothetical protein
MTVKIIQSSQKVLCKLYLRNDNDELDFIQKNSEKCPGVIMRFDAVITNIKCETEIIINSHEVALFVMTSVKMTLYDYIVSFFEYVKQEHQQKRKSFSETVKEYTKLSFYIGSKLNQAYNDHYQLYKRFPNPVSFRSICITHDNRLVLIDIGKELTWNDNINVVFDHARYFMANDKDRKMLRHCMPVFKFDDSKDEYVYDTSYDTKDLRYHLNEPFLQKCVALGDKINLDTYLELINSLYPFSKQTIDWYS